MIIGLLKTQLLSYLIKGIYIHIYAKDVKK
jgi:hypothetical protein